MRRFLVGLFVLACVFSIPFGLRADGNPANVTVQLSQSSAQPGESFYMEVLADSGQDKLGAFHFEIEFDPAVLELDTETGLNGVEPGGNGFAQGGTQTQDGHCIYVSGESQAEAYCVNVVDGEGGKKILRVNGFNASGVGPGSSLSLIKVHFKVKDYAQPGSTTTIKLLANSQSGDHPMGIVALIRESGDSVSIVRQTVQSNIEKQFQVASGGPSFTLDIDGNGTADALTDGVLIVRYLLNFRGSSLITGAVGNGATRTTADDIEDYIESLLP